MDHPELRDSTAGRCSANGGLFRWNATLAWGCLSSPSEVPRYWWSVCFGREQDAIFEPAVECRPVRREMVTDGLPCEGRTCDDPS